MDAEALEGIARRQNLQLLYLSDGRVKPGAFGSRVPGFKCHHYHPLPSSKVFSRPLSIFSCHPDTP